MNKGEIEIAFEESETEGFVVGKVGESLAAPWLTDATAKIGNPNFRLHNEIIDFYNYVKPSETTNLKRFDAFSKIKAILEDEIEGSSVLCFGSFATQLYLPQSDVDLVILNDSLTNDVLIKKTKKVMNRYPDVFLNVDEIKSKVPIIKFTEEESGVEFDISFNEVSVIHVMQVVITEVREQPEIKYLIFILKVALKQRAMNNTFMGGVGSFLLFLLVLSFLSEFKNQKRRAGRDIGKITLAEYLIEFLQFWGKHFSARNDEVVIGDRIVFRKKRHLNDELTIYSPLNDDNVGSGAYKYFTVFNMFKNRAAFLQNYAFQEGESILKYLINPSSKDFRNYLK